MKSNLAEQLHLAIAKVCPIDGVFIGNENDKSTWRVDFKGEAIESQRKEATNILNTFTYIEIFEKSIEERVIDLENRIKLLENK